MAREVHAGTKRTYEDPLVVRSYLEAYGANFHKVLAKDFLKSLNGKRVLDLGCGPGHYTRFFSDQGMTTVGIDYSEEMIRIAKEKYETDRSTRFEVVDMRDLGKAFPANSFDGVWANASLLHISPDEIGETLDAIFTITANNGKVFIRTKAGDNTATVVNEHLYGKDISREFTFWERETFRKLLEDHKFIVTKVVDEHEDSNVGETNRSIDWLQFYTEVRK